VVVAGGALMTPGILRSVLRSPALGKHLSIHPASKVMAVFDEAIDMGGAIPQGYAIEEYAHEGIMFEGASTPLDMTAVAVPWVGRRFVRVMESYRQLATFGFMIEDTSRGEVRPGQGGSPRITYNLNTLDTAKMAKAMGILCEVFLAAGARRVFPFLPGQGEITSNRDLAKLRARDVAPGDLEVTAYHPLGTARIGTDRKTSVCGANHETHEVERLYVVDSSSVPSSLGVNPQLTIMAMAHRAAELLDVSLG
jgi:hypothetical protein